VLVTGALGQIGVELVPALQRRFGKDAVVASDIRDPADDMKKTCAWRRLDVLDLPALQKIVKEDGVTRIIHLSAILSAVGEKDPLRALEINNTGTQNIFEVSRQNNVKLFVPSTIAVFGPSSPKVNTPDDCVLRPTTIYGITKIHTELLCEYYHSKFGMDVRSLRYPGVISSQAMPGGGTTDYAVDIYHKAVTQNSFNCFLTENTALPMIYMPDLLKGTINFMEADEKKLTRRVYNLTALSFTPKQLAESIKSELPGFSITYSPDFRQKIADSWPSSIDDSLARRDWGWKPDFDVEAMTKDMLRELKKKYNK
jgi:threonine 3-dehydrogenase